MAIPDLKTIFDTIFADFEDSIVYTFTNKFKKIYNESTYSDKSNNKTEIWTLNEICVYLLQTQNSSLTNSLESFSDRTPDFYRFIVRETLIWHNKLRDKSI